MRQSITSNDHVKPLCFITGGSGGIGQSIVRRFSQSGHRVVILDRSAPDQALLNLSGENIEYHEINLSELSNISSDLQQVIDRFGSPDILINCAGINQTGEFCFLSSEKVLDIITVNFSAVALVNHTLIESMAEKESSVIVNVASRLAGLSVANNAIYSATKAGVVSLTRQLALEYGAKGVRVNSVSPGLIATQMNQSTRDDPKKLNAILGRQSIQGIGEPDDVASVVAFLCSGEGQFISGEDIRIDGGFF